MKRVLLALLLTASPVLAADPHRPGARPDPAAPVAVTPPGPPLTLKEAFRQASQSSEQLVIQSEQIVQAKARIRQTRGGILPNFRFIGTEIIQDTSGTGGGGSSDERGPLAQRSRTEARLNLTQPIFQGFKESAALSGLRADERREQLLLRREATILFQRVARTFFDVVSLETQLVDVRALMKLSTDRTRELRERVGLGKSRISETTTAESQLATYRAQEAALRGSIVVAREELSFLIGTDVSQSPVVDDIGLPRATPPLEDLLQRVEGRSDVAALREEVDGRRAGIKVAKAGYWPSLSGSGNYYLKRPPGAQEDIDWDVVFTLNAPLYQGGAVRGLQQEAQSLLRQSELNLARQTRLVTSDVRKAHALLASSILQAELLEDAVAKSKKSYELMSREYRLGVTNNLDVLQAMDALQAVKRDFDLVLLQSKLNLLNLRLAVEMAPENLP